jgi:hypothetical protein
MLSELSIQYRVFKKAVQKIELKDRHLRRLMASPNSIRGNSEPIPNVLFGFPINLSMAGKLTY